MWFYVVGKQVLLAIIGKNFVCEMNSSSEYFTFKKNTLQHYRI